MALKTITFTVKADKTLSLADGSHATIQDGGMQGDHKATALEFKLDGLYSYLQTEASNGKLVYRFDATDGEGTVHHSDTANLTGRRVTYPLEYTVTCHGGLVKVELIISRIEEKIIENKKVEYVTNEVLHTKAAELKLTFSPYSTGDKSQPYRDLSTLAEVAKQNAEKAEAAAAEAKSAQQQTENAKTAFQNGTTYIFNGGNASGEIKANFIVDTELSDYSTNAVQNKAIKKYVDDKYPVGSIWVGGKNGSEPIDPSEIFGGTWLLFDKEFKRQRSYIDDKKQLLNYIEGGTFPDGSITVGNCIEVNAMSLDYTEHRITITIYSQFEGDGSNPDAQLELLRFTIGQLGNLGIKPTQRNDGTYESSAYTRVFTGQSDNVNAINMLKAYPDNNTGDFVVSYYDRVIQGTEITSGTTFDFTFSLEFLPKNMIDSFCDKFYWKRTQ